jgi:phosphoenolpyruvate carboxykinase (GTP)
MATKLDSDSILKTRLSPTDYQKLAAIYNPCLHDFIANTITLCNPHSVFIATDSKEDIAYIRQAAIANCEEHPLAMNGHTIHFDGIHDQGRDKAHTKFLVPHGTNLGPEINALDREAGLQEINGLLSNIMDGHTLYVKFYCLGPTHSAFSIPCLQLTDSAYVAHSEDLLYRQGYQEFVRQGENARYFKFIHSQGALQPAGLGLLVSKNIDLRRVYIDLEDELIYSINTQYGGNSIGLKKLAMRLGIQRGSCEGWLTEHMLLMGIHGPDRRVTYLAGAFPSMCGKTSTAMMAGETIVGDDIAFLRNIGGVCRAVNVEAGMFGIIDGINETVDPLQWNALTSPPEILFSNKRVTPDCHVHWNGKTKNHPASGVNFSGDWHQGKTDASGKPIPLSHKNARFTFSLDILPNVDPALNDPHGVEVQAIVYGGRDSDTSVPVEESYNWVHGIIMKGASLESETTAATLGAEGVRIYNPMSNLDFLSIPIERYIEDNLRFGAGLRKQPRIFGFNYFLKDEKGSWLSEKNDKAVWLKWIDRRVHDEVDAITSPTGMFPKYEDLRILFSDVLHKQYGQETYRRQFTIRVLENLAKIDRIHNIYQTRVMHTPEVVFQALAAQRQRLQEAQARFGDYIAPEMFQEG